MDNVFKEFDQNDPSNKERVDLLEKMNAEVDARVMAWSDLYDALRARVKRYTSDPSQEDADELIAVLFSFVLALEQLPEEGDAVAIAKKLNEICLMRPDLTGIALFYGNEANAMRLRNLAMMSFVIASSEEVADAEEQAADTRVIH